MQTILLVVIVLVTLIRVILNSIIYREEYDYHDHSDGVALNFDPEEVTKRDNSVALIFLSLITLFWYKNFKPQNKIRVYISNILSIAFIICIIVFFLDLKIYNQ